MRARIAILGLSAAALTVAAVPAFAATTGVSIYTFPSEGLAAASNAALPGSVKNDSGIQLGGFGSDLFRSPGSKGEYWVVTDRGPNNDTVMADGNAGLGFPVPDFSPLIMKIKVAGGSATIAEKIAIQTIKGVGVTGLPNVPGYDQVPTTPAGAPINYNVNGLDTEGVVRTKNGDFWLVDEYGPSLIQTDADGVVKNRFVPKGWKGTGAGYPVTDSLPAVLLTRKGNRGFEALAMSPDEKYLFIGLQSPLLNPDKKTGDASLQTRILRMDLATKVIDAEWVYKFEAPEAVDPTTTKPADLKLSAMVALTNNIMLVQERTDNSFIVSQVALNPAQSILGSTFDTSNAPTLESLKPTDSAVTSMLPFKNVIFRSTSVPEMPKKVEGMAVENANTLAFVNDNDFAFIYDTKLKAIVPTGAPTQFLYVTLAQNLPTTPDAEVKALAKSANSAKVTAAAKAKSKVSAKAPAKAAIKK
ncbi:MAG: esterase-like activity of phytase family protein [Candidatus Nanopelagicales bacterium]|nr:esterase-like activity of phytase family protein [Candidatus Nanopelagicales bacterium]